MTKEHFVYITIDHKRKMFYLGRHFGPTDLSDGYFGSSLAIRNILDQRSPHQLTRVVLEIYPDHQAVVQGERDWGKFLDVVRDKQFYNRNECGHGSFAHLHDRQRGENHPRYGAKHSDETKRKISERKTGTKFSDEVRLAMSLRRRGEGHWAYGKSMSEYSKTKNRETNLKHRQKMLQADPLHYSKFHYTLSDPDGVVHETYYLNSFARDHDFNASNLAIKGATKGWTLLSKVPTSETRQT